MEIMFGFVSFVCGKQCVYPSSFSPIGVGRNPCFGMLQSISCFVSFGSQLSCQIIMLLNDMELGTSVLGENRSIDPSF